LASRTSTRARPGGRAAGAHPHQIAPR
jgi:hypothetical protein